MPCHATPSGTAIGQCQVAEKANPYSGSRVLDTDLGVLAPAAVRLPCRAKEDGPAADGGVTIRPDAPIGNTALYALVA
jgi:hypothetical protein